MRRIITQAGRLALVPALACSAGLASAADSSSQDRQRMTLEGEVESFGTINLSQQGEQRERGLARVRLENGRSAIVDLGDRRDLRNVDIAQGDHVMIGGTKRTIAGRTVLSADRLRVREQEFRRTSSNRDQDRRAQRGDQRSQRGSQQAQGDRSQRQRQSEAIVQLQGDITDSKRVGGQNGTTTLLKVELDNGMQRTVVIPPHFDLTGVELESAGSIQLVGKQHRDQRGDAVVAKRLRIDGQEIGFGERWGDRGQVRRDRDQGDQQRSRDRQRRQQDHQRQQLRADQRQQQDQRVSRSGAQQRQGQDTSRSGAQQRQGQDTSRSGEQQGQDARGKASLSGTVESFAKVRLKDAPEDNLFARVRLEDGTSRIVDFGRISSAKLLKLSSGDEVQIKGMQRQLGEHRVLEARSVRIRDGEQQQRGRQAGDRNLVRSGSDNVRGRNIMLQGRVEDIQEVEVGSRGDRVTVMKIKLKDGTSQLVNLSPYLAKQFLDIEQGDEVVASGVKRETNSGREVLIIDGILVTDDRQTRAGDGQDQQRASSGQAQQRASGSQDEQRASASQRERQDRMSASR